MMELHKMLFTFMIACTLVYESSAIYCYDCNSASVNGSACLDPLNVDEETRSLIPIVDCEAGITSQDIKFFCRKIIQTIYLPKHEAEVRVTRGCGWVRHEDPCYRTRSFDSLETSCQCFTDMCNSAETLDSSTITALFLLFSAILYWYR